MNIKKLAPDEYEKIRYLFHDDDTNLPFVYGIIEGLTPGQIWVDNKKYPKACLIIAKDPYCLIAGMANEQIFQDFFNLLKQKKIVKLQCNLKINNNQVNLLKYGFVPLPRREYRYKSEHIVVPQYDNFTKYILKKIEDAKTFDLCMCKYQMLETYKNADDYLKNAIGFILWDQDKQLVVSEAHVTGSKDIIEITTETHKAYRNQKLSTIVCNYLIHYVINKGFRVIWACDESNIASWKIAEKQGMDVMIKYTFFTLNIE